MAKRTYKKCPKCPNTMYSRETGLPVLTHVWTCATCGFETYELIGIKGYARMNKPKYTVKQRLTWLWRDLRDYWVPAVKVVVWLALVFFVLYVFFNQVHLTKVCAEAGYDGLLYWAQPSPLCVQYNPARFVTVEDVVSAPKVLGAQQNDKRRQKGGPRA